MNSPHRNIITVGVMLGMFLSALEITVLGTAAPLIVRDLGGFESYSWLFSMYLLTSTIAMPFWGRAADHWGRRNIFIVSMSIFMVGSILCGMASTFEGLILFRGIKGIGGGGLVPIAFTILADIYDIKTRTKIQGYLGGVWGVAAAIAPFIGGVLAETFGWRWIFFINVIPGFFSIAIIYKYFDDRYRPTANLKMSLQSFQTSFLFVLTLLLGLHHLQNQSWLNAASHLGISFFSLLLFIHTEKKAENPLIPPRLFNYRIFTMTCLSGFLSSIIVIPLASFMPLLFQVILKYSPTQSGLILLPFTISWIAFGILSVKLLLKYNYKSLLAFGLLLILSGMTLFMVDFFTIDVITTSIAMLIIGAGMAFNYPILLITAQYNVPKNMIGFSTSGIFWIRNLGSTIGITLMGMTLNWTFKSGLTHWPKSEVALAKTLDNNIDFLLQPQTLSLIHNSELAFKQLHQSLFYAFLVLLASALLLMGTWFFFPKKPEQHSNP